MGRSSNVAVVRSHAIPENDPAWLAAINAPFDDTPETEQELADIAEAHATGRFSPAAEVHRDIEARRPR